MDRNIFNKNDFSALDEYEARRRAQANANLNSLLGGQNASQDTNIGVFDDYEAGRRARANANLNSFLDKQSASEDTKSRINNTSPMTYESVSSNKRKVFLDKSPKQSYDRMDTSARDYAYSRDARNQMDDMISDYKASQRSKHRISDNVMKRLSGSAPSNGRRRAEFVNDVIGADEDSFHYSGEYSGYNNTKRLRNRHPLFTFILLFAIGLGFIGYVIINPVKTIIQANESQKTIESYTPVSGIVTFVDKDGMRKGEQLSYYIDYTYKYDDKEYKGHKYLSPAAAATVGLDNTIIRNKTISVYVNPSDPEKSMITTVPYPQFYEWLFAPAGIILVMIAFVYKKKNF